MNSGTDVKEAISKGLIIFKQLLVYCVILSLQVCNHITKETNHKSPYINVIRACIIKKCHSDTVLSVT